MTHPASDLRPVWNLGLIALFLNASLVQAGPAPLNGDEQARVNRAIDGGVAYLKRSQSAKGGWAGQWEIHTVGYAALPGLTLLECGVSAEDPGIQRVAAIVRREASHVGFTYEIALSILFLDRLGDAKDRELIQTLAARLIAGQTATGGWSYKCPFISKKTQEDILDALRKLDPPEPLDRIAAKEKKEIDATPAKRKPASPPLELITSRPTEQQEKPTTDKPPAPSEDDVAELPKPAPAKAKPQPKKKIKADRPPDVPAALKRLPVFRDPDSLMKQLNKAGRSRDG